MAQLQFTITPEILHSGERHRNIVASYVMALVLVVHSGSAYNDSTGCCWKHSFIIL